MADQNELKQLRRELAEVMDRVAELSGRLRQLEAAEAKPSTPQTVVKEQLPVSPVRSVPPPLPAVPPAPVQTAPAPPVGKPAAPVPTPEPAPARAAQPAAKAPAKPGQPGGWEMTLGSYWLPRVGILLLAMAAVYALSAAMDVWGPWARVGVGYLVCAGFLGCAWWLERKYARYAQVLFAGGLGLSYFVTYAAHFLPYARIIESGAVGIVLLAAVVLVWTVFAHIRRSSVVAMIVVFMGNLTVLLTTFQGGEIAPLSVSGILVLGIGCAFFLLRHRWYYVAAAGLVGCYANHLAWALTVESHGLVRDFWIALAFLASYFLIFALAELFSHEDVRRKTVPTWFRTAFLTLNSAAFFTIGSLQVAGFEAYSSHQDVFRFCFALVLLLFGLAYLRLRAGDPLYNAYFTKAVAAMTYGLSARYGGSTLTACLAVQTVVLLYTSRRSGLLVTRILAFGTAALAFIYGAYGAVGLQTFPYEGPLFWRSLFEAGLTILAFFGASQLYQRTNWDIRSPKSVPSFLRDLDVLLWQLDLISVPPIGTGDVKRPLWGLLFPFVYAVAGTVLFLLYTPALTLDGHRTLAVSAAAFALTIVAALLASRPYGLASMALTVSAILCAALEIPGSPSAPLWMAITATVLLLASALRSDTRILGRTEGLHFQQNPASPYFLYASAAWLLGLILRREMPHLGGVAALAGAALIAAVFVLRLHPGAMAWVGAAMLAWAAGRWAVLTDIEPSFFKSTIPWALVAAGIALDRYYVEQRRFPAVPIAGMLTVAAAWFVSNMHVSRIVAPYWLWFWGAAIAMLYLAYALVFRSPMAGGLSILGAAWATVLLLTQTDSAQQPHVSLVAGFLAVAVYWGALERCANVLGKRLNSLRDVPLDLLFCYMASGLLVLLPWRVPLRGAYLIGAWAGLALALFLVSLLFSQKHYRYAGLAIFALAIGRAFLNTFVSSMTSFQKAGAFFVLCIVVLLVAYGYHRAMAHLAELRANETKDSPQPPPTPPVLPTDATAK